MFSCYNVRRMEIQFKNYHRKGTSIQRNTKALAALDSFIAREGHASVPSMHVENGYHLGHWVTYIRARKRMIGVRDGEVVMPHLIEPELIALLDSKPGWVWGPLAPGPYGLPDRNALIVSRHQAGATLAAIGEEFGISRQRAHQIIHRELKVAQ